MFNKKFDKKYNNLYIRIVKQLNRLEPEWHTQSHIRRHIKTEYIFNSEVAKRLSEVLSDLMQCSCIEKIDLLEKEFNEIMSNVGGVL